jgi:hypothetical protein
MRGLRKYINHRGFYISFFVIYGICFYVGVIAKTSDAFRGAFFGFIVGIMTFFFSKYMELQARRYNSLVYIEQELHAAINDLSDNKFQIKKIFGSEELVLLFPCELRLTEEYIKYLGRMDMKNDIFSLYVDFKKYNHSIKTAIEIYERNVDAFKDFESQKFVRSSDIKSIIKSYHQCFKGHLHEIDVFGDKVFEGLKICLIRIRFFAKIDKPLLASNIGQPYYDKKEFEKWLIEDKGRLEQEMVESAKRDEEERQRI